MKFTSASVLEEKECQAQEKRRSCNNSSSWQQHQQQRQSNKRRRRCNRFFSASTTTATTFHSVALLMAATIAVLILPYQSVVANDILLAETTPTYKNIDFNTTTTITTIAATSNSPTLANIETNHNFTMEKETRSLIAHKNTTNLPISTQNQDKDEDNEILTVLDDDGIVKDVKQSPDFVDSKFDYPKISALTENLEETIRNSVKTQIELEQNIETAALLLLKDIPEGEVRKKLTKEILALEEAPPKAEKLIGETTIKPKLSSTTEKNTILDKYVPLDNKLSVDFFQQEDQENPRGARKLDAGSKLGLNSIANANKQDLDIQSIDEEKTDIDSSSSLSSSSSEPSSTDNSQDDAEDGDDVDDNEPSENAIYNNADTDNIDENLNNGNDIPLVDFLDLKSAEISYPVTNTDEELSRTEEELLQAKVKKEETTKAEGKPEEEISEPTISTTEILNPETIEVATPLIETKAKISESKIASEEVGSEIEAYTSRVPSEIETQDIETKAQISEDHNSLSKTATTSAIKAESSETEIPKSNIQGNMTTNLQNYVKSWNYGNLSYPQSPVTFGNEGTLSVVFKEALTPDIQPMKCLNYSDEQMATYTPIEDFETTQIPLVDAQEVEVSHVVIKKQGVNLNEAITDDIVPPIEEVPEISPETTTITAIIETTVAIPEEDDVEGDYSDEEEAEEESKFKTNVVTTLKPENAINKEDLGVNKEVEIQAETTTTIEISTPSSENIEETNKEDGKFNSLNQIPSETTLTNEVSIPKAKNVKLTISENVKVNTVVQKPSDMTPELKSTEYITTTNVPEDAEHEISVSLIGGNIGTAATKGSRSVISHDEIAAKHLELLASHVSGQTFNDNLGAESAAGIGKALPKTDAKNAEMSRSTVVIAICSSAAILFLVISIMIFLLSFHRQHGTLDIEMQEQRCGKDNLDDDYDDEDDQAGTCTKLLEVELPTMSTIIIGDETEECL